jgi:MOSC domain-containing protein YiiM
MSGTVSHIHIGSHHGAEPQPLDEVRAVANHGLEGDRNFGSIRNVTIVCEGELAKTAADLGTDTLVPGSTRRNITVTLDELPRTHGTEISIGEVLVEVWRDCSPCELMETAVGPGARVALRGRAGISATITRGGVIRVGDPVVVDSD